MASTVNTLLTEAVADLVRAFSYETNEYLKKTDETEKNKLHNAENWKPIFDKVAKRYIEDLNKRGLDAKKRVLVDMKTLLRPQKKDNKYLNLLQSRKEIQDYLKKQIVFYSNPDSLRIMKYRDPKSEEEEEEIKNTTPTPKISKAQQEVKDIEVGLSKGKTLKPGASRHFGGIDFENKVAKTMANEDINKVKWINNKIAISMPGIGENIAEKIYELLKKSPEKAISATASYDDIYKIAGDISFSIQQTAKADFEYDGIKYEVKKQNLYQKCIFGEIWKIATEASFKRMAGIMGSDERAKFFYNNFIQKIISIDIFKNRLTQEIKKSMIKNNIHLLGLCGPMNSNTVVGIFKPQQLEFSVGLGKERMETKRLTIFVKVKNGQEPIQTLGKYSELKEAIAIYNFTSDILLKENANI